MSDRTASRLTRILAMLPWVIANPGADVDEVCERFGYTRKDLIKDLDLVFVCGLPGYGPGDLMVAYVEEDRVVVDTADYFAKAPRLTAAEGLALLASGMTVMATGQGTDVLAAAVDKLGKALVPDGHEILTVDVSAEHDLGGVLRNAAINGRVVEIVYTTLSRGDTTTRLIEPWTVFTSLGNWYVSAHCRRSGGERIFRLDRIQRVTETDERFDPPATPPEPDVRYTPSEDDVTAIIRLSPPAFWVADYYPVEIVSDDGAGRTVRFSAYDASVAAQLLIRLGADATLIEGDEVGAATEDLRSRMLARYTA
jgi:proteasome accessory factor C